MTTLTAHAVHPRTRYNVAKLLSQPHSIWKEARPGVQLVFAMRCIAGMGLAAGIAPQSLLLLGGWIALSIAVYVFNGIGDVDGDRRNGSQRPLASGRLGIGSALAWSGVLAAAGLAACALVSVANLVLGVAFAVLGWCYSAGPTFKAEALSASVVIGAGAGLTYAAGLATRPDTGLGDYLVAATLALWVCIACNSKDFSDVDGDTAAGRRTLPVLLGPARAARVIAAGVVACATFAALVLAHSDRHHAVGMVIVAGSVVLGVVAMLTAADRVTARRRRSYRIYMLTQYALNMSMMVGL